MIYLLTDSDARVYLAPDPRGESETYEAFSLVAMRNDRVVWTEGIRKNRSAMRAHYRQAINTLLGVH